MSLQYPNCLNVYSFIVQNLLFEVSITDNNQKIKQDFSVQDRKPNHLNWLQSFGTAMVAVNGIITCLKI